MMKPFSKLVWIALALLASGASACGGEAVDTEVRDLGDAVQAVGLPDLVVTGWSQSRSADGGFTISATITNQGTATAPYYAYYFKANLSASSCYGATWGPDGGPLAPGASRTFTLTQSRASGWTYEQYLQCGGVWTVQVDWLNGIAESNEANNTSTFPNQ